MAKKEHIEELPFPLDENLLTNFELETGKRMKVIPKRANFQKKPVTKREANEFFDNINSIYSEDVD